MTVNSQVAPPIAAVVPDTVSFLQQINVVLVCGMQLPRWLFLQTKCNVQKQLFAFSWERHPTHTLYLQVA